MPKDRFDLSFAQYRRDLLSLGGADRLDSTKTAFEHLLESKQQRMKCLVLRRGCNIPIDRQLLICLAFPARRFVIAFIPKKRDHIVSNEFPRRLNALLVKDRKLLEPNSINQA